MTTFFGITNFPLFVATVVGFLFLPGPGNLMLVSSTSQGGIKGGYASMLGIMLGDQVLLWLALCGLAAVLSSSPEVFHTAQALGAGYLVWVGVKMIFSSSPRPAVRQEGKNKSARLEKKFARQAFLITLLNPKAVIFYMAFFPLFVDPAHTQGFKTWGVLAATVAVLVFIYASGVIFLTHHVALKLKNWPRVGVALEKLAGLLLIVCAVQLLRN